MTSSMKAIALRLLTGIGVAAILGHAVYLDLRARHLQERVQGLEAGLLQLQLRPTPATLSYTDAPPGDVPRQVPLEDRIRRLEDDAQPRARLLFGSGR